MSGTRQTRQGKNTTQHNTPNQCKASETKMKSKKKHMKTREERRHQNNTRREDQVNLVNDAMHVVQR
jgi:hypothetical protein